MARTRPHTGTRARGHGTRTSHSCSVTYDCKIVTAPSSVRSSWLKYGRPHQSLTVAPGDPIALRVGGHAADLAGELRIDRERELAGEIPGLNRHSPVGGRDHGAGPQR